MKANTSNPKYTKNYSAIVNRPYFGVEEYLTPDTQRDAINVKTSKLEAHNHCKNTSVTMMLNWVGIYYGDTHPIAESLSTMGEHQYNVILEAFMRPEEKIQNWTPHLRGMNALFQNAKIPLKASLVNFRKNEVRVMASLRKGFPVVLGTVITPAGHIVLLYRILYHSAECVIIDPYGEPPKYKNTTADYYILTEADFDKYVNGECNAIILEITK